MALSCSYKDCFNQRVPCSKICFFSLPLDPEKREKWIQNSGNKSLIGIAPNAKRIFCENHFDEKFMRRQFHRTTLHPAAELIPWKPKDIKVESSEEVLNVKVLNAGSGNWYMNLSTDRKPGSQLTKKIKLLNNTCPTDDYQEEILECKNVETMFVDMVEDEINNVHRVVEMHASDEINTQEQTDTLILQHNEETIQSKSVANHIPNGEELDNLRNFQKITNDGTNDILVNQKIIAASDDDVEPQLNLESKPLKSSEKLDEDQYFCLNVLSGLLKRLPPAKKSEAKLHILSYLYELEQK